MNPLPAANPDLLRQLRWRYAVKKLDASRRISAEHWTVLEEALVLTPSSYGLQPWKFIVVTNPDVKAKLKPVSWNQQQVVEASHLVVFAVLKDMGVSHLDRHLQRMIEVRGGTRQSLEYFRKMVESDLIEGPRRAVINEWAARQVYIALGNFMTVAALLGIDTCPMEGIEPEKYDETLGLGPRGLTTVVACVAGYRAADDKYARLPKVRFNREDVIEHM